NLILRLYRTGSHEGRQWMISPACQESHTGYREQLERKQSQGQFRKPRPLVCAEAELGRTDAHMGYLLSAAQPVVESYSFALETKNLSFSSFIVRFGNETLIKHGFELRQLSNRILAISRR